MRTRRPARARSARAFAAVIEQMEPRTLLTTFTVTSVADAGAGSLRQAMTDANVAGDVIAFAIPAGIEPTIRPQTPLPGLGRAVTIDGTTQPGYAGSPLVEVDGSALAPTTGRYGFFVNSGGFVTIRGLAIFGFAMEQIRLTTPAVIVGNHIGLDRDGAIGAPDQNVGIFSYSTSVIGGTTAAAGNVIGGHHIGILARSDDVIQGNYIGLDPTGTFARRNSYGIYVGGNRVTIGGAVAGARNVISGNGSGIWMPSGSTGFNTIQGNYIGTDVAGLAAVPNGDGIVSTGQQNLIGGPIAAARNVIAGNTSAGVKHAKYGALVTTGLVVQGNHIGLNAAGQPLGNEVGVYFDAAGGLVTENVIAHNQGEGVAMYDYPTGSTSGMTVSRNAIYGNGGRGIKLHWWFGQGVPPNDPLDGDFGVNGLQNYPVIGSAAAVTSGGVAIAARLDSKPNQTYRVEFFRSEAIDPSGFGEGKDFLGFADVTTDADGRALINESFAGTFFTPANISATATDAAGSTSEFSATYALSGRGTSPPRLVGLSVNPTSALRGEPLTLTASGASDVDGDLHGIWFYRESNGLAGLQTGAGGDATVGFGGDSRVVPTDTFPSGPVTFYARAVDRFDRFSPPVQVAATLSPAGRVFGNLFNDQNFNGYFDPGESAPTDWRVYADLNGNATLDDGEPRAVPSGSAYTLKLAVGLYTIRVALTAGWVPAVPLSGAVAVTLTEGQSFPATFGAYNELAIGRATGTVYDDANWNGVRDAGEVSLPAGTVLYDDSNDNQSFDPGERSLTAGNTGFEFLLPPGYRRLRVVAPADRVQTEPTDEAGTSYSFYIDGGQRRDGLNFGLAPAAGPVDIVIDNNFATLTGAWRPSNGVAGFYGSNFAQDGGTNKGQLSATYAPQLPAAGTYDVYAWWPAKSNRSTRVPYAVAHAGGTSTVFVNQRVSGGQWNKLGSYAFAAGTGGSVVIRNAGTSGYVAADAVRFVKAGTTPPPADRQEVVLDNSSAGVTRVGTWTASTYDKGFLGANYLHDGNAGKGARSVSYKAALAGGTYAVYARWTSSGNKASNVPVDVRHAGGTARVTVDQRVNGGAWVLLGQYAFDADGTVTISNAGTNGFVVADGVKFVPVG